jgi:acyl-CoA synthetase (AMP-forming)/AMP-acid ligase II
VTHVDAIPSEELLWPRLTGPADLAEVERVPLADRGLPASTYELVARAARLWPDRTATSVMPDAERWQAAVSRTFGELAADVHRAANVLGELGVERDDAVAVVSVNCAELLPLLLAAEATGIFAPINPALGTEHATELVRLAGARVIVASGPELDPVVWEHARTIARETGARALLALRPTAPEGEPPPLEPLGSAAVAYLAERMAGAHDGALPGPPPAAGDVASYLHTGGTTGTPKLAARTHANEVANAWMISSADLMRPAGTVFAALPPPAVREAFQARTGAALCEGYGLTEGTCASTRAWPDAPRPGTVGQRLPYQEVRTVAVDEATGEWRFLPAGEVGTIVLRGPNVFAGYLTRGESGTELHTGGKVRDGWLDTGDLGAVDAEGFIHLAGRAKDLIIRGGHNIDPATIEDALLAHPAVAAVGAVGRPDVHSGEVPVAFIALAAGAQVTVAELEAWAAERVPERAAAPRHVEIVDEIPLTAVGKPYKPELRRRAAQQAAKDALAGTSVHDRVRAELVHGTVEVVVPRSPDDETVQDALSAYAWTWRLV